MGALDRRLAAALAAAVLAGSLPAAASGIRGPLEAPGDAAVAPSGDEGAVAAAAVAGQIAAHLPGAGTIAAARGAQARAARSAREALLSVRDHSDVARWLGAVATATSAITGQRPVGAAVPRGAGETAEATARRDAALAAASEEPVPAEEPLEGSWSDAIPAGDLDGDGAADVLVLDVDLGTWTVQTRALSGADGRELWRLPFEGDGLLAWPLGRDVTGDGLDDLLAVGLRVTDVAFEATEEGDLLSWRYTDELRLAYTWTTAILSGGDGAAAWSESVDGALVERFAVGSRVDGSDLSVELSGTNIDSLALPAGEELLVEALDLDVSFTEEFSGAEVVGLGSRTTRFELASATRAALRDVGTGAVRAVLDEESGPSIDLLLPAGDLSGDGAEDLLWERLGYPSHAADCLEVVLTATCSFEGDHLGDVHEAVDGRTLEVLWSRDADDFGFLVPLGEDLDGDGTADLLRFSQRFVEDQGHRFTTAAVSGRDGVVLWTLDDPHDWLWPVATGHLGGAGATDLLAVAAEPVASDGFGSGWALRVDRLDGATGAVLATSEVGAPPPAAPEEGWGFSEPYVAVSDDRDGDGAPDLVSGVVRGTVAFHGDEDGWHAEVAYQDSAARFESGRSGQVLATESHDGELVVLRPTGDLDGDGVGDALRLRPRAGRYTAIGLPVTGDRWTREVDPLFWYVVDGGRQGGPGASLLEVADTTAGEVLSTVVTSVSGVDGAPRWSTVSETRG